MPNGKCETFYKSTLLLNRSRHEHLLMQKPPLSVSNGAPVIEDRFNGDESWHSKNKTIFIQWQQKDSIIIPVCSYKSLHVIPREPKMVHNTHQHLDRIDTNQLVAT